MPLNGLRVVALEQAVAGPFCSRQLADHGADVIKIERPDGGDSARAYDDVLNGTSAYFAWLNRGKQSVVLDLKVGAERDACSRLIDAADVVVNNLAPGAMERLGFGYDEVSARNPRIVWCGISGYGPDGPMRDKKAYDMLVQAESGVVSVTGSDDANRQRSAFRSPTSRRGCTRTRRSCTALYARDARASANASTSRCSSASPSG